MNRCQVTDGHLLPSCWGVASQLPLGESGITDQELINEFCYCEDRTLEMAEDGKKWMSTGAAAMRMGCSRQTIVKWCRSGILGHYITPGKQFRVLRADIERLEQSNEQNVQSGK